jgi:hypothetical protein
MQPTFKSRSAPRGKRPSKDEANNASVSKIHKGDTMSQTVVERTAEHLGESVRQASRATSAIADAVEDGIGVVRPRPFPAFA